MQICPYCSSEDIFYSKKRKTYLCGDCDRMFTEFATEKGMRVFISYGHDDNQSLVDQIKDYLVEHGYDVWIDTSCIPKGSSWRERIADGLIASNGVIAFLSRHSVRDPGVCLDELRIATRFKRAYVKAILLESAEEVDPPYHLADRQWIDMGDWRSVGSQAWERYFEAKMQELINALESEDARQYERQMQSLAELLRVDEDISKEQRLLRETFIGRQWLAEQTQAWYERGVDNRMVISGVPGSGKSSFAANLSQYHTDIIAALFLEWDKAESSRADKIVCQLAYKIAANLDDYRNMLLSRLAGEREKTKHRLSTMQADVLFDWLITEPISCCLGKMDGRSLVIVDGLDETGRDTARLLFKKAGQLPEWIRVLFTTRIDETMMPLYAPATQLQLDGNSQFNREDISHYVIYRLGDAVTQDQLAQIVDMAEGSFIYVKTLCDALLANQIDVQNLRDLPTNIGEFYEDFMRRLFPTPERFAEVRPFFELLSTEDDAYEVVVCLCMQLDNYELWELRKCLGSLVVSEQVKHQESRHRIVRFAHKTIRDWMTDRNRAGDFFVDSQNGYRLLLQTCEHYLNMDRTDVNELVAKLGRSETEDDLRWMLYGNRYRWMVRAGDYDRYKRILLSSFDEVRDKGVEAIHGDGYNYMYYYRYFDLWRWADELPLSVSVDDLMGVLEEIITFPRACMHGEFAHRSFQISLSLLLCLMKTGRFRYALYTFIRQISFPRYFMSSASDLDGDTRDGWDKYFMARDAAMCVKSLQSLGVSVPSDVRAECERMKLTYHYYRCERKGMFSGGESSNLYGPFRYGVIAERGLYKDICRYVPSEFGDEPKEEFEKLEEDLVHYNTTSLRYYLAHGDDVDDSFVRNCADFHANVDCACKLASEDIKAYGRADASSRLDYIESVRVTAIMARMMGGKRPVPPTA